MSSSVAFLNRTDSQVAKVQEFYRRTLLAETKEEKDAIRKKRIEYENAIDEEHDLQVFLKEISGHDDFA